MYIKIYTKSQMILLRNVTSMFKKKYRLPSEILDKAETVLISRKLGRTGFIAILLEPIESGNDAIQIEDTLNCYPHHLILEDDIEDVVVKEDGTWLTEGREWYMDTWKIQKESSYIYIIYSMTIDALYDRGKYKK